MRKKDFIFYVVQKTTDGYTYMPISIDFFFLLTRNNKLIFSINSHAWMIWFATSSSHLWFYKKKSYQDAQNMIQYVPTVAVYDYLRLETTYFQAIVNDWQTTKHTTIMWRCSERIVEWKYVLDKMPLQSNDIMNDVLISLSWIVIYKNNIQLQNCYSTINQVLFFFMRYS